MKLRVLLYCLLGGLPMFMPAMGAGHLAWWYLSGVVLASAFVPIALFGPRNWLAQFCVIALTLWIVSALCTLSEAYFFFPKYHQQAVRDLGGATVIYLVFAAVLAILASVLKLNRQSESTVNHRGIFGAIVMVLLSGFAYVLYYLVFGSITYQFFTKAYYPEGPQLVAQLGIWFWVIELGRGVLMALAVLPAIYTLRMSRKQSAIVISALLWIAGGLAPLLVPNELFGPTQRIIHIVEILTQNAPLGITAVLLLRPKQKQASPQTGPVVAAIS